MTCRHCHKNKVNRSFGLCWLCYYKPGLRSLYSTPPAPKQPTNMGVPPEIVGEPSNQNYASAKLAEGGDQ